MRAEITETRMDNDGYTWVNYEILEGETVIARHTQGFPPYAEREPVRDADEQVIDNVATGRILPADRATIEEAIRNYCRDVGPLVAAVANVAAGDSIDV